ncbi:helix-turn-helix domain-containing protein [Gemmiger formicilis]|jgi:AraC-like DNA-binding protein|nr:helix-turn-helix domain-containing protein [Gemmiger formicilis]
MPAMKFLASHESSTRGTFDFPIELYYVDKMHPRYEMPFHWHMEFELMLVLSGEFSLLIDGRSYLLHKGDAAIISAGAVHGGTPNDCVYECVVFDMNRFLGSGSVCQAKYNALFERGAQIEPYQPAGSVTCQLIDRLFEAMEKEPEGYEFVTIGLMWQLFGQILLQHSYTVSTPGNKRNDRSTAQMKAALERIRKNYASRITLEDLASTAEMTPEHFCRVFHSITGRSPIDYLNYYRVECAAELLCSTEDPITEIAYSCGFSDSSYFNRMFRRYKAEAPGKYRKLHSI